MSSGEPQEDGGVDKEDSEADVEADVEVDDVDPELCKKRACGDVDDDLVVGGLGLEATGRGEGVEDRSMVVGDDELLLTQGSETALAVERAAPFDR